MGRCWLAGGAAQSPTYNAPRVVVCLQQGASLTLTEEFNALHQLSGSYFANSVLEASLGPQASLSHRWASAHPALELSWQRNRSSEVIGLPDANSQAAVSLLVPE